MPCLSYFHIIWWKSLTSKAFQNIQRSEFLKQNFFCKKRRKKNFLNDRSWFFHFFAVILLTTKHLIFVFHLLDLNICSALPTQILHVCSERYTDICFSAYHWYNIVLNIVAMFMLFVVGLLIIVYFHWIIFFFVLKIKTLGAICVAVKYCIVIKFWCFYRLV